MLDQLPIIYTSLIVVLAVVAYRVIDQLVLRFFSKTVDTEYMTVSRCIKCREDCKADRGVADDSIGINIKNLAQSIDVLRGIVLVLAVKVGVDEKTLQDIASNKKR